MQLPDNVKAIRARYVARFPVPQGAPGDAFEEEARQWSIAFAEQVAFELNDPLWGMKRADPNRPISKDTIAYYGDDRLLIWDLLSGTGTGRPTLNADPESQDVTGQFFVRVTPTNHLGIPPKPGPQPLPPADLGPVLASLEKIAGRVEDIAASVGRIEAAYQAHVEDFAAIGGKVDGVSGQASDLAAKIDALAAGGVHIPDADFLVSGRVVGKIKFH